MANSTAGLSDRARILGRKLSKLGFEKIRQEGSHIFFRHPDGRTTVVPNHPGEKLDRGLHTLKNSLIEQPRMNILQLNGKHYSGTYTLDRAYGFMALTPAPLNIPDRTV